MSIKYLNKHGKLIVIDNILWFSVMNYSDSMQIVYYLSGDDKRHELRLSIDTPYLVDNLS